MKMNNFYKWLSIIGVSSLLFFTAFLINSPSDSFFIGQWVYPDNNSEMAFSIHIFKKDNKIVGQHCYYRKGIGSDCSEGLDISLYDMKVINDHTVEFTFETWYGPGATSADDSIGKVRLIKINKNKTKWKLTDSPKAAYLVPTETTLVRSDGS